MPESFGKLVLTLPDGQHQEFELARSSILLGRATTSDVVLPDARASRTHARIDCSVTGCTLVDLGSANGTWLKGQRVTSANLAPGDTLTIGDSRLTYEVARVKDDPAVTQLESEAQLAATMSEMALPRSLNDTSGPRLVVKTPDRTWEVPLKVDSLSIGRREDNDLALDFERVSRQHARLERKGPNFVLRDLGSTNGTWLGTGRIDERRLENGDTFRIGAVQFVFKAGFTPEAMTIAERSPFDPQRPRRRVVFVPGFMGSELWLGSQRVWPNVPMLFRNPELFRLPDTAPIEPRGILDEIVIVPNLIKSDQYNRLGDYLVEELGYERGVDLLEFAYDWRQDVRQSAKRLAAALDTWGKGAPVTIIAHSLGTLVSRYYVEKLGGRSRVERLILMGGPHQGTPQAAASLVLGPNLLPFGYLGDRLRDVIATFPSSYQILPTYPCLTDQHGKRGELMTEEAWLSQKQRPLVANAREFRSELGMSSSVPTLSIFGYGLKTVTGLSLQRGPNGEWGRVRLDALPGGDSTIPEVSAVLPGTEIHPVQQYHGSLFVDNDVKMRLKLELTRWRND
jgi:pSer/pThr/pTyr-binding forkhead associated (FHA) protein